MANEAYLSLFKEESEEHLQMMNQNLLALEKNPNDIAVLNEIFRNAHTLKGMAATMNFQKITELSHNMENLMDALRSEQLQVEQGIIDTLFSCFDALEILVEEAVTGESKDVEISQLVASINSFTSGEGAPAAPPEVKKEAEGGNPGELLDGEEKENARKALQDGYILCFIKVTLDDGCLLKAARAYMVFRNLEEAGKIIKSIPSREEIEDEKFELDFSLFFATSEKVEEIQKSVENISEINHVDIISLSSSDLETDAPAAQPEAAGEPKSAAPPPDKIPVTGKALDAAGEKVVKKKEVKEEKTQIVHTVRVDIKRLDALMNLVGELVISRTQLVQVAEDHMQKELSSTLAQVGRVVSDLQDLVMKVRMVPIEQVFNRFPRMVRDLTKTVKKKINL